MSIEYPKPPGAVEMLDAADLDIGELRAAATQVATLLRALANEDRLMLLCQLSQGELSVSELEERAGIPQPTLSQQLAVLRSEQLVATRRDGRRIFYSIADPKVLVVIGTLYQLYCPDKRDGN